MKYPRTTSHPRASPWTALASLAPLALKYFPNARDAIGANAYQVKEFLGHEYLQTLKHYTRLTINDLRKTHAECHPREKEMDE